MYQIGDLTNLMPDDPKFDDLGQALQEAYEMEKRIGRPVGIKDLEEECATMLAIVYNGSVYK